MTNKSNLKRFLFVSLFVVSAVFTGCGNSKTILFSNEFTKMGDEVTPLIALDSGARNCLIKENGYASYKFSDLQKNQINEVNEVYDCVSVSIHVKIQPSEKQQVLLYGGNEFPFYAGFLYEKDFDENGKLKDDITRTSSTITVQAEGAKLIKDLNDKPEASFEIALAVKKDDQDNIVIPEGVFVYSAMQTEIINISPVESYIGFDKTGKWPKFGFSSNGGVVDPECASVDFSGGSLIFPTRATTKKNLPEIIVNFSDNEDYKSKYDATVNVILKSGGEQLELNNVKAADSLRFPVSALKTRFQKMDIVQNRQCVDALIMKNSTGSAEENPELEVLSPIRTDPGIILKYNPEAWRERDYEVYQWDTHPDILIFDFKTFAKQSRFFTRLAYFVEKAGYRGTLVTNEQIGNKHGYNAHDYRADSLADFYNKVTDENFTLNKEELILKQLLINAGILVRNGKYVKGVSGGVASVSLESGYDIRQRLMNHEVYHTVYFIDEEFRNYVTACFYTMDPDSKNYILDLFKCEPGLNYDINDEYLVENEFMAYIMQQKLDKVGKYFVDRAYREYVQIYTPDLAEYVINTKGSGFTDAGRMLETFTFDKYGLKCGTVNLITKD